MESVKWWEIVAKNSLAAGPGIRRSKGAGGSPKDLWCGWVLAADQGPCTPWTPIGFCGQRHSYWSDVAGPRKKSVVKVTQELLCAFGVPRWRP